MSDKNRLSTLFPEIAAEWHPTKNGNLTPDDFTYGSSTEVWWLCPNGHKYSSPISRRTNMKSSCPTCRFSKGEKRIKNYLISIGFKEDLDFIPQYRKLKDCKNIFVLPFDFYLPKHNLCIEYHGEQHYILKKNGFFGNKNKFEKRKKNDKIKEKYCYDNGINLPIIPYWDYDNIEKILEETLQELERS